MDPTTTRPRKRRRISSSEDVTDQLVTETRVPNKNMATEQVTTSATPALPSLFEDFRTIITCKICFRLLYEPFTLACGHTHCYSCLCEWFGRTEDRRKTCPDCRAAVKQVPAPAYIVRELTQKYIQYPECLPEGESTQQHEKARAEESAMVEAERGALAGVGLFRGMFFKPERLAAMVDEEDGVVRCRYCAWELEPGEGMRCFQCGADHDGSDSGEDDSEDEEDMDEIEYPHGWPPQDDGLDVEIDDDYMDNEDELQMLDRDPFGPPPGAGFETGGETYYVSSGDDDDAEVQEIGRRRRRPAHRDNQGVVDLMRADGEARRDALSRQLVAHEQNLINGGHIPHRRREARGSTSPGHPSDVDSDEEEDYDSEDDAGSLDDFVVREGEESTIQHDPEFSSMYNSDEDDVDVSVTIQAGRGSDDSNSHSSSSEDVRRGRNGGSRRPRPDVIDLETPVGRGRGARAPAMVSDPSSSEDDDSDTSSTPPPPSNAQRRRGGHRVAARTEEESADEALQRVIDEADDSSEEERVEEEIEEAIQRVMEETEGVEGSSSEEEEDDEDDMPVRRGRSRR